MDVPPITDDDTHRKLLRVVEALMELDPPLGSVHGEYLDALARAIEEYERKTWPI
jgi:antitoxin component HigA of HigAB toxin-antitoxin module